MTPSSPLSSLVRLLCDLRLAALTLAIIVEAVTTRNPVTTLVLLVALPLSYVPSVRPTRIMRQGYRGSLLLLGDVLYATMLLLVVRSPELMLLYALATVCLGGLVYGLKGARLSGGVMSGLLLAAALASSFGGWGDVASAATLIGYALLYALAAAGAHQLRRLLDEIEAAQARASAESRRAAGAEERARLAREMHDGVSKTVHGTRLLAMAARKHATEGDAEGMRQVADDLVMATETAATDARRMLRDLRTDAASVPLAQAFRELVEQWGEHHDVEVALDVADEVPELGSGTRFEAMRVVGEALENVRRHAGARHVTARLVESDGWLDFVVEDDGVGMGEDQDLRRLGRDGHYGLLGMHERATRAGGRLDIGPAGARGTRVVLRVPAALPTPDDGGTDE